MKKTSYLARIALRHSTRHPIQSFLLILGVALGVAMMVAVDLANSSASQAFSLSTESIAGRATHQITAAPDDIPSRLYRDLRVQLGLRNIAPVVSGPILLAQAGNLPLRLLGVDPFAEAPFRNYLSAGQDNASLETLTTLLVEPDTILLSQGLGQRLGLAAGDRLTVIVEGRTHTVRLVGLLRTGDDLSRRAIDTLALADISTAQEILGKEGALSHIDLILSPEDDLQPILDLLPETARLQRASLRNETLDQLTAAFEFNLSALSLLGVVVGMFLIYNTISFSVVQRRPVLGVLRCLGVTRREIFGLVLTEAIVLSAIGAVIGLGLGILIGRGLVGLVSQSINDLFFTLTVQGVALQPLTIYKGITAGIGSALLAAAIPAFEATTTPPISVMKRSTAESRVHRLIPWLSLAGLALLLAGSALLAIPAPADSTGQTDFNTRPLLTAFGALFFIVIGMALFTPALTKIVIWALNHLFRNRSGIVSLMALRDIVRSLSRTSVTIAALMISVSVIIGVSVMITSFRSTVVDWLNTILLADIFISPTGLSTDIDPAFIDEISRYPDIERVDLARITSVYASDLGQVQIRAFSEEYAGAEIFLWSDGSPAQAVATMQEGAIFVTEVFARQNGLPLNRPSQITLLTQNKPHSFPVAGIFYNYTPQGFIRMNLQTYQRYWDDDGITNVALYLSPNLDADQTANRLQAQFSGQYQLDIVSNRGLKESALIVFDRTFTITLALRLLATLVAFIGVLSALMSLQLEKTRELGTLRANGMTVRQLWRLIFQETGFMGITAGLIAMPTGLIMAAILIYVINLRSFGWSLQLQLTPQVLLLALAVAVVASLLAGLYPAFRASKIAIASALREE